MFEMDKKDQLKIILALLLSNVKSSVTVEPMQ